MKLLILVCLILLSSPCFAVTGNDLVDKAHSYDGRIVAYQGEVIGDIMLRGEYAWLNVNDGERAIGIWAPKKLIQGIKFSGSYTHQGDRITAVGKFNRACSQHGGDLDIHAKEIQIVKVGHELKHPINPLKVFLAISFFIATLALIFLPKLRT